MTGSSLRTPPKLAPDTLRVIPLGGLGDVGRNMATLELNGKLLLIDCGVLFPEDHHPGVDLILPGLDAIDDRFDDVVGLVLTHGHEDHIGAVPYLLRRRPDIPIFGSKLTLALVESKIREHRIKNPILRRVVEGDRLDVGEFDLEFLAVNHSIPDALAVFVRTSAGTVLHTGDFKMDQLPLDGRITDLRSFARLGAEGVDLFMCDSTNAEVPGFVPSEREIEPAIARVFAQARQKLIVACFASHVHRVQQVLDMAVQHDRKVVYVGRSMVRNMQVARDLGYLKVPENTLVDIKDIEHLPDDKVVIISTGSQGEPLSALARIANREHPVVSLGPGDTVLLASSLIPGNENAVYRVINGLTRLGANVVHKGNALVHVSGHAAAGELLYCYNILKPRNVMPVHGEVRHLVANGALAIKTGIAPQNVIITEDGGVVDLARRQARLVGKIDASYIFVDGSSVGDITESQLTDRRILGEEGFISIVAAVNLHDRSLVSGPEITARGFAEDAEFDAIIEEVRGVLLRGLKDGAEDAYQLQQQVRRTVGRWVNQKHRRRPMIVPVIVAI
ncbi:ribonuclease J [Aestuariimicrobium kwangyangense]|uniref:ribonuclease J n=1 Tax=Aestuariimicrobium kwangyangense TaxID=396389 RepID=UPI0003B3350F|nr:ribonuclease J [Aestuariimicrobium kwangyangense]